MVRRIAFTFSRLIAWLLVIVVVGIALMGLALQAGPIPLTWLTPYIERALTPDDHPVRVTLGETQLRLGEERVVELVAVDVAARSPDGETLLQLPEVTVGLSTSALFGYGLIAPDRLAVRAPRLFLARRDDGSIGLGTTPTAAPTAQAPEFDLGSLAALLTAGRDRKRPLSWLDEVRIEGGRVEFEDRVAGATLRARDAHLVLERRERDIGLRLEFRLAQPQRPASIAVTGAREAVTGRIGLSIEFADLAPPTYAPWAPDLPIEGLRLSLDGWIAGTFGDDLAPVAPLEVAIADGRGVIDLPGLLSAPLPVARLQLRGAAAPDLDAADLQELELASRGATLKARGAIARLDQGVALMADLEAQDVAIADLAEFWPPEAGAEARGWVVEHLTEGVVPHATARIELAPGDLAEPPVPESVVSGRLEFRELSVRYVDTMPPLTGVEGSATFTARRMDFAVTGGGVGDLRVQEGAVAITGIGLEGRDTTRLEVTADIAGPIPDALALIDHPPLGFASALGVAPADAAGHAEVALKIGLPLHREVDASELEVGADAVLTDAAIRGLGDLIDLSDGRFQLHADNQAVDLTGSGTVNDVPLEHIAWHEDFDGAGERRYELRGEVPVAALEQLGVAAPIPLEGALGVDATIAEAAGQRSAEVALDLEGLATEVPWLDWGKRQGEPARLDVTLTMAEGKPLRIEAFELAADGLEAAGRLSLELEPLRLQQLILTRLRTGETSASVQLERIGQAGYDVTIDAASLDLDPWLQADGGPADIGSAAAGAAELRLRLSADRLLFDDQTLSAVAADVARGPEGWRSAEITARLPGGAPLELTLVPQELQQALQLSAGHAGDLLRLLDQEARVEDGRVALSATVYEQRPKISTDGKLEVRDFTVVEAPLLARLLTLASLTGIRNLLGGEGIRFDRLEVPFSLRDGILTISQGRMSGSQVGLTIKGEANLDTGRLNLDGTVVPVYTLNRVIGNIPLIGTILSGREGEGAFAATYRVTGTTAEPQVTVNPLAILTPGLLRELFSGIIEGNLPPPDVPQDQD